MFLSDMKQIRNFIFLVVIFLSFAVIDLLSGSVSIPAKQVWYYFSGNSLLLDEWKNILSEFRIPRLYTALLAGSALSLAGLQMQTLFRNPLAGPYVLGISSGASLGVALLVLSFNTFVHSNFQQLTGSWAMSMAALIGAAGVMALIFFASLRIKDIMTILIIGILFGSISGALVSVLQYFSDESLLKNYMIWTMGSLGGTSLKQLSVLAPLVISGVLFILLIAKGLNASLLGEASAQNLGINTGRIRIIGFISTSLLAGSITAFCGPIAFVGIVVPHLSRMFFKSYNHFILIPGCILIGSILMLFSDIVTQLPGGYKVLPINSVTALLGIPIVIYIVVKNRNISFSG